MIEIADAGLRGPGVGPDPARRPLPGLAILDKVVAAINASGYGLTLGVHSLYRRRRDYVAEHARVGNLYVNRNQIGAVVGVQPFGGEGLSGTGPKAGGPNYLARFATERVRATDITATGGNVALLGLDELKGRVSQRVPTVGRRSPKMVGYAPSALTHPTPPKPPLPNLGLNLHVAPLCIAHRCGRGRWGLRPV